MVLVEDGAGAVFEIVRGEDRNTMSRELLGESGASVVVFEGCYAGRDFSDVSVCLA